MDFPESQPNMLEEALKYADLGFSVIPLQRNKRPYFNWKEFQKKRADKDTIRKWWNEIPDANIGIVTGQISGIVVVDIEQGGSTLGYPTTIISKTGGGGFHFIYKHPGEAIIPNSTKKIAELTDIRGDGGYIMAPPSIHPNGTRYEWSVPPSLADFIPLPQDILEKIKEPLKSQIMSPKEYKGGVMEGSRNNTGTQVIGSILSNLHITNWEQIGWAKFQEWNLKNIPPLDEKELRNIFDSISKLELSKRQSLSNGDINIKTEFKITKSHELFTKEVQPFPYIVDRLVPEKAITSITADSGKGKSMFALLLAKYIASGEKLFDEFEIKQKKVLIIDQEMNEDIIVERYRAVMGVETEVDYLCEQSWIINEETSTEWLKNTIFKENYGVVILDTFTNIHRSDENKADEMRDLNRKLLQLIRDTGVTIIYLHHHRKPQKGEKLNQSSSRGSTEIIAKVSSHLLLDSNRTIDENGRTITQMTISQEKARRPEGISSIGIKMIFNPKEKTTEFEYLGEVEIGGEKLQHAKSVIIEKLQTTKQITFTQLKEEKLAGDSTIRRALKELVDEDKLDSTPGAHNAKYYFLRTDLD